MPLIMVLNRSGSFAWTDWTRASVVSCHASLFSVMAVNSSSSSLLLVVSQLMQMCCPVCQVGSLSPNVVMFTQLVEYGNPHGQILSSLSFIFPFLGFFSPVDAGTHIDVGVVRIGCSVQSFRPSCKSGK